MDENAQDPGDKRLAPREIVAFAQKQQELAFQRFSIRRGYEWKVSFGLWTAFGAASGLILNAQNWRPSPMIAVAITLLAAIAFAGFWRVWIPWVFDGAQRDGRVSYWWNTVVESHLGLSIPDELRPGIHTDFKKLRGPWERHLMAPMSPCDVPKPGPSTKSTVSWFDVERWFEGQWRSLVFQTWVTGLMGALLATSAWSRALEAKDERSDITIDLKNGDSIKVTKSSK